MGKYVKSLKLCPYVFALSDKFERASSSSSGYQVPWMLTVLYDITYVFALPMKACIDSHMH